VPKRPELRERLEKLHEELGSTDSVDDDARELLGSLLTDITSLLDRSSDADTSVLQEYLQEDPQEHTSNAQTQEVHTPESLSKRLEAMTREWETSHPTLAAAVGRVMDTLSNMGI